MDWLKAHEAFFLRAKTQETADLTGTPQKTIMIMGAVNYRPLKQLSSPGLIVEPPKHQTSIVRIRVAIPAQPRIVQKLLEPKSMRIPEPDIWVRNSPMTQGLVDPVGLHS